MPKILQKKIKQAQKYLEWGKPNQAIAELKPTLNSEQIQKEFKWVPNHLMGLALSLQGKNDEAIRYLEKAARYGSDIPDTYQMLSEKYYDIEDYEGAEKYGRQAVAIRDDYLDAWLNLGKVYQSQAKLDEALECYKKVNEIDPKNTEVALRIGEIYRDQGDLDQAMKMFDVTLQVDEDHLKATLEKADLYKESGQLDEALEALEETRETHGDHPAIKVSEAEVFKSKGDYDKAIELYEDIIDDYPDNGPLLVNYALCLQEVSRFEKSEKVYRQAIEVEEDPRVAISNYLMGLHYNPQNSKGFIFKEHKKHGREFNPKEKIEQVNPLNNNVNKKLKIGFISSGFRRHPVGWMIVGALEQLREEDFELVCYTTDNRFDFITRRIHRNIDDWKTVIGYSDKVIKNIIRDDELDILVDLTGHAADNCMNVMACKPAPIMVKWVGGLFNTTGVEAFDYLITDDYESPEGEEQYYTEKLVRMPDDYITFTPPAYAPDVGRLPAKENGYVTFGCFNNPTKVNKRVLRYWANIMQEVPESRLYLKSKQYDTASFREQILEVMGSEGIAKERIEFEGRTGHEEHLDSYNKIDIALDPWPYSGGLTTCEALYMGVPVITVPGPTFAGRHSTTHLMNAGLEQWVTDSWEKYTEKAVALANDWDELEQWRSALRDKLRNSPVCDGKRFGAHLSVAFREMWKQRVQGDENGIEDWQSQITVESLSNEAVNGLTDGPEVTPLITIKDEEPTKQESTTEANHNTETMNGSVEDKQEEKYSIETKDGVTVSAPADTDILTTYVLLEQEEWFESELNFVRDYVKQDMTVIDAGAGFGAYSLPMAKQVGPEGAVYAFEPGAVAKKHLEVSKIENGFDHLEVVGRGLGENAGEVSFETAETPELNRVSEQGEKTVPLTSLDAWWGFAGKPEIDFLKVDVNGMEAEVLAGGSWMFEETDPVVLAAVGEKEEAFNSLQEQLKGYKYQLFEYIPGPGVLADYDSEAGMDPYQMNVIGIPESRIQEFKDKGWIFDESVEIAAADQDQWKQVLNDLPWTSSQMGRWADIAVSGNHEEYFEALNLACAAEQIQVSADDPTSRSRKGGTMLTAAQKLIGLFNSGQTSIAAAMTYIRLMSQLGKTMQAMEMAKQLMEKVNSGQGISVELPCLPPLPEQDTTDIQTDFSKWLTVRVVEAWISLQNPTTFMAGEQERGMLEALEGNPEAMNKFEQVKKRKNYRVNKGVEFQDELNQEPFSETIKSCDSSSVERDKKTKKKSLFFITTDFPPYDGGRVGHSIRAYTLATFFAKKGYKVYLVILQDLMKSREAPPMHDNIVILNFVKKEVEESVGQKIELVQFCSYWIKKFNINFLLTSSPPISSHLIAYKLKDLFGNNLFWICDIRDIISIHPLTRKNRELESRKQKKLETTLMSASDVVTTVTTGMRKTIFDIYEELGSKPIESNFHVVENGYIERDIVDPQNEIVKFVQKSKREGRVVLFYAGTGTLYGKDSFKGGNKDLSILFKVIANNPDFSKNLSIIIQGKVDKSDCFLKKIKDKISFKIFSPVSNKQILANLREADIGINLNLDKVQTPGIMGGKLYDYIYCGLGLLLIYPDNAYSIYEFAKKHNNKPFIADIEDVESISKTLKELISYRDKLEQRKFNQDEVEEYNRYVQYEKIEDILSKRRSIDSTPPSSEIVEEVELSTGDKFDITIPRKETFRLKNIFEGEEYKLPDEIKLCGEPTIIDIGANVGSFALYASLWADNYKLFCYEPNPQVLSMLKENTKNIAKRILPYALSDENGSVQLWQHPNSTGGASVSKTSKEGNRIKVPVKDALTDFQDKGIEKIDVLKIDTEGSEVNILKSLQPILKKVKIIMVEYHSESDRVFIEKYLSDFTLYSRKVARKDLGTLKYYNNNLN